MKTKKEPDNKQNSPTLMGRADLPTIFCDRVFLSATETTTKDPCYIMSWAQKAFSENFQFVEQSRTMVTEEHLKKIIDALCNIANYYPTPHKEEEE